MQKYYLHKNDQFCKSLRLTSRKQNINTAIGYSHVSKSVDHPSNVYRRMKLLPRLVYESTVTNYSGIPELEDYIFHTKEMLDKELPRICIHGQNRRKYEINEALDF